MLNEDISEGLKKEIVSLIEKIQKESTISNITMTFTCPKQPDYKVYLCREIMNLTIHQDFIQNFTDKITADLMIERDPYIGIVSLRKNLFCKVSITFTKPDVILYDEQYSRKPDYEHTYKCILTKYEDLFKKMPAEKLYPTKRKENDHDQKAFLMSIELIDEDVYKARKESLCVTGRDTTMLDMMRYCINYFGFKKAVIVKPDNTRKYSNFVIPPSYGVEEIFSYLQNAESLGIYSDGLVSYIVNGCWFVYPRYGKPIERCPIHVYCAGCNMFVGLNRMDWVAGEDNSISVEWDDATQSVSSIVDRTLNLVDNLTSGAASSLVNTAASALSSVTGGVSDSLLSAFTSESETVDTTSSDEGTTASSDDEYNKPNNNCGVGGCGCIPKYPVYILSPDGLREQNWTSLGSENIQTDICAQMSELLLDSSRTLVNDKKTVLEHRTHAISVVPPDTMDYEEFVRVKHIKSGGNLFRIQSEMRSFQGRTISFKWMHARPWVFMPGTIVTLHYDDYGKMEEATGSCEKATYSFKKDLTNRLMPRWVCDGEIEISCPVREESLLQSQR